MRSAFVLPLVLALAWLPARGQDAQATIPLENGSIAPVLLPDSQEISTPKHCEELDGVVKFAATIDIAGVPQEIKVLDSSDYRLTSFATQVVKAQRFKPGAVDGSPTQTAVELTVGLHTCAQREMHPADNNLYEFTLRAHPLIALAVIDSPSEKSIAPATRAKPVLPEHEEGKITPPVPTVVADPKIPVSGKLRHHGLCLIGVTVDTNGFPQNVRVVRSLDPELDSNAIDAVKHWRFKPALRDGNVPIPVEGTVAAVFGHIDRQPVAYALFELQAPEKVNSAIAHHDRKRLDIEAINFDEVIARYKPRNRFGGRCLVSLLIDTKGVPQNVHVVKELDSSLDMDTVAMIEQLRFKPVQNGTTPVAVGLVIPVRYRTPIVWSEVLQSGMGLAIFLL